MRKVLRRPDFRLLFAGVVTSMIGESVLLLVLAIWVKTLSHSSGLAGLTLFAIAAPALLAPLLGWVVDRFRRRPFLVAANLVTAVALTPLLLVRDRGDLGLLYGVAVLYGASMLMVGAGLNGLIKELLPEDLLAEANGALQTVRQGLRLVGPIGGAGLFTVFGPQAVIGVDLTCLVLASLAIGALRVREERPEHGETGWISQVAAGVRFLLAEASLRRATAGLALAVTVIGLVETLIFAYVDQGLHRGPAFVSVIVCVQGIGGLTGGLAAAGVVRRLGEIGTTAAGVLLFGIGFAGLVHPSLALAMVSAVVIGWGIPLAIVGFNTLLQRVTPAPLLGRVGAASEAMLSTPQALSIAAGAALVSIVDYRVLFAIMAVVMVVAALYLWTGRTLSPASSTTNSAEEAAVA
jgi:MFS family permease